MSTFGLTIALIAKMIPNKMNGMLNNWPMFSTMPDSHATWSFFTNSMRNLGKNMPTKKTPKIKPGRVSAFFFQYIHIINPNTTK